MAMASDGRSLSDIVKRGIDPGIRAGDKRADRAHASARLTA
jgi:hypothetical protein